MALALDEDAAPVLAPDEERFALVEDAAAVEGDVAPFAVAAPPAAATPLLVEVGRGKVGDAAPARGVEGVLALAFTPVVLSERDGTALLEVAAVGEEELTEAEEALPSPSMCGAAPALGLLAMGVETFVLRSMCSFPWTIRSLLLFFSSRVSRTAGRECAVRWCQHGRGQSCTLTFAAELEVNVICDTDIDDTEESLVALLELFLIKDLDRNDGRVGDSAM